MTRHHLFSALTIALILTGCGAQQSPVTLQSVSNVKVEPDGSWMLPEAKNQDLLYVSNYSDVAIFTYPGGKQVGDLKGFTSAAGECVDNKGNVFITAFKPRGANEYAHGGTKRLFRFRADAIPEACAINPTTGELVISGSSGYVEIYKGAGSKPSFITDNGMVYGTLVTYDDSGDLFFIGLKFGNKQHLSELLNGSSQFVNIKADASIYVEGGLQWHDGLLTATSNTNKDFIYRFQVSGTKAHKVGATPLGAPAWLVLQYFIDGNTVIVPSLNKSRRGSVLYYQYPAGGEPTFTLPGGNGGARAVVVSRAE